MPATGRAVTCPGGEWLGERHLKQASKRLGKIRSMGELIRLLEPYDDCGTLDQLADYVGRHAPGSGPLRAATLVVSIARARLHENFREPPAEERVKRMARRVAELRPADREVLVTYAAEYLARKSEESEVLLAFMEGTIPTRGKEAIVAAAPRTIPAGPWMPPGDQPINLYIGSEAHRMIAMHYEEAHKTEVVFLNNRPISAILRELARMGVGPAANKTAKAIGDGALRPDITNLSTREIYEIKPAAAEALAAAKLSVYIAAFAKKGVTLAPGRSAARGTTGVVPAPAGHFRFHSPRPGVIVYRYSRGDYVPSEVLATEPEPKPKGVLEKVRKATGLTGTALVLYLVVSEGSRVIIPARNLVPVP